MGEKRFDWIGFRWAEFGDTYEVIAQGELGRWIYQRTRNGKVTGGGIRSSIDMERCLPLELAPAEAPAAADAAPAPGAGVTDPGIVRAIRGRSEATHLDYPHSRAVVDVGIMLREYAALQAETERLRAELAAARERVATLERAIEHIIAHKIPDIAQANYSDETRRILMVETEAYRIIARHALQARQDAG